MSRRSAQTATQAPRRLRICRPSGLEEIRELRRGELTIGRASSNDIVITDTLISRLHARILREGDRWVLSDCGSKNGTLVGGRAVEGHVLEVGDEIQVGDTVLVFEAARPEQKDETSTSDEPMTDDEADREADEEQADIVQLAPATPAGADVLERIALRLDRADGELTALDGVVVEIRSLVACDRASVVLVEEGTGNPLMQFSRSGQPADGQREGPEDHVIRAGLTAGQPICLSVPRASAVLDATLGVSRHVLLVPLADEARKLGLLILEREPSRPPFVQADLQQTVEAAGLIVGFLRAAL